MPINYLRPGERMANVVRDRGVNGHGAIKFRQNLNYPRTPGEITYYPPEPSDEMRMQVQKERAGGLITYILGFAIVLIGYLGESYFSDRIELYATLIPFLLVLGLVFAILFLWLNSNVYAKLSRTMPMILLVCLILLYISSILFSIVDIGNTINENNYDNLINDFILSMLNPAFFLMTAGLMICGAGGNMLLNSLKVYNEFIPGMIIIETPGAQVPIVQNQVVNAAAPVTPVQPAPVNNVKACQHCNKPLEYIEEYGRYYCYDCQEYAPADR